LAFSDRAQLKVERGVSWDDRFVETVNTMPDRGGV
jgi:hypothetical protein